MSIMIGRGSDCDIVVDDAYASVRHAQVTEENGVVSIEDLGSSNGTWLNGVRVWGKTPVRHGDRILIGRTEVTIP